MIFLMRESVEEIFFDIIPDFPTPEKITFPLHLITEFTILSKSLFNDFLIPFKHLFQIEQLLYQLMKNYFS